MNTVSVYILIVIFHPLLKIGMCFDMQVKKVLSHLFLLCDRLLDLSILNKNVQRLSLLSTYI